MRLNEIASQTRIVRNYKEELLTFLNAKTFEELQQLGVTFTRLEKVGVNPKTQYSTPAGVYFYPAQYVRTLYNGGEDVPFAGDQPHINVISLENMNLLDVETLTPEQVISLVKTKYDDIKELIDIPSVYLQKFLENWQEDTHEAIVQTPAGIAWYLMYRLVNRLKHYRETEDIHVHDEPMNWVRLFQIMGYDGAIDYGNGIIHRNEPTQGFIVSTQKIKLVERFSNRRSNHHKTYFKGVAQVLSRWRITRSRIVRGWSGHAKSRALQIMINTIIDAINDVGVEQLTTMHVRPMLQELIGAIERDPYAIYSMSRHDDYDYDSWEPYVRAALVVVKELLSRLRINVGGHEPNEWYEQHVHGLLVTLAANGMVKFINDQVNLGTHLEAKIAPYRVGRTVQFLANVKDFANKHVEVCKTSDFPTPKQSYKYYAEALGKFSEYLKMIKQVDPNFNHVDSSFSSPKGDDSSGLDAF